MVAYQLYDTGLTVTEEDELLSLSTCEYSSTNGRLIVLAEGGKIMFGFDKMFDFNRDGKLDSWERAAQCQFMDEMMRDDEKSIFDDDEEIDTFADAGLDYDELEFMDPNTESYL